MTEKQNRFLEQHRKAVAKVNGCHSLYDYIDAVKYVYSLSVRYKTSMRKYLDESSPYLQKMIKAKILTPWKDTYYFDKQTALDLQMFLKRKAK